MNKKNLDLYSKIILRVYNENMKFVYELCYKIYIDIRMTQKSNVSEKSFNLCFKMNIKFIMKI